MEDVASFLERRVQVLYAGSLAEALVKSGIDNNKALENIKNGGQQGYTKIKELVNLIRNTRHPDTKEDGWQSELDKIDPELWNEAASIVESERKRIEDLSSGLVTKVSGYDIRAELSRSDIDTILENAAKHQ